MSQTVQKINKVKEVVKKLLLMDKRYRDDDEKLVSRFWYTEIKRNDQNTKKLSAWDFLIMYADGKFTSADIITRCRRKLQEEDENLRGEKWAKRHAEEKETRNEIKNA